MEEPKLTIEEWEIIFHIKIYDPDGFNRTNPNLYNEKFTFQEFLDGQAKSTQAPMSLVESLEQYQKILNRNNRSSPKREEKCINCKYYEKIEIDLTGDLNGEIRTTCWEECNHPSINEALIWNAKEIGCTEFESKTE